MLLKPYQTFGVFTDQNAPYFYNAGKKTYVAVSTSHSYKTLQIPSLKVVLLGPHFENKIRAIAAVNEFVFVAVGNTVYKMKYYHAVKTLRRNSENCQEKQAQIVELLLIGNLLITRNRANLITIWNHQSGEIISQLQTQFKIIKLIHPPTYLNKILIVGQSEIEIWNISNLKQVYSFEKTLTDQLLSYQNKDDDNLSDEEEAQISQNDTSIVNRQNEKLITCVQCSPVIDVIAIAVNDGNIYLINIKKDSILFSFKQKNPATCLSFSQLSIPLMASGDSRGNIVIWDMNQKQVFSSLDNAHQADSPITSINFLNDAEMFLSFNGSANSIRQWKYEEFEQTKFALARKRDGLSGRIQQLKFKGEDGNHILASSTNSYGQLRDFSLLNECMSVNFSLQQQGTDSLKQRNFFTERSSATEISEIVDFSFSLNRERDWANVITAHQESGKACLWTTEDHSIIKKPINNFEDDKEKNALKGMVVTSVFATYCGNFAVIGYDNGWAVKINLQSGMHQRTFKNHSTSISGIFVNHYNQYLITVDIEGKLVVADFYSGGLIHDRKYEESIDLIRGATESHHFAVSKGDFAIEMIDMISFQMGRNFIGHKKRITDFCFTNNNQNIISSSLDQSIQIWDIMANQLLFEIVLDQIVVSLDVSGDGQLLATAFANSREINLWHNMIQTSLMPIEKSVFVKFASDIKFTDVKNRKKFYEKDSTKVINFNFSEKNNYNKQFLSFNFQIVASFTQSKLEEQIEQGFELQEKGRQLITEIQDEVFENYKLIRFTELEDGQWKPLAYLDEIKQRNQPKNQDEVEFQMPFFLDFENQDQVKQQIEQQYKDSIKQQSKIIKENRDKYLAELGTGLEMVYSKFKKNKKGQSQEDESTVFSHFKSMFPSQIDFEIREYIFGQPENLAQLANSFSQMYNSPNEIDLKIVYFNAFLRVVGEDVIRNPEHYDTFKQISEKIQKFWNQINDRLNYVNCLLENFSKLPL